MHAQGRVHSADARACKNHRHTCVHRPQAHGHLHAYAPMHASGVHVHTDMYAQIFACMHCTCILCIHDHMHAPATHGHLHTDKCAHTHDFTHVLSHRDVHIYIYISVLCAYVHVCMHDHPHQHVFVCAPLHRLVHAQANLHVCSCPYASATCTLGHTCVHTSHVHTCMCAHTHCSASLTGLPPQAALPSITAPPANHSKFCSPQLFAPSVCPSIHPSIHTRKTGGSCEPLSNGRDEGHSQEDAGPPGLGSPGVASPLPE